MKTARLRIVLGCLVAVAAVAAVVVSSAAAKKPSRERRQNNTLSRHNKEIKRANTAIKSLGLGLSTAKTNIGKLQTLSAALPAVLTQLGNGLTAINTALQDPTTGLVGLNHARPQFGAFNSAGVIQGGTGQASGGSGPSGNATVNGGIPGVYVVDFGNDVSKRVYSVNVFPYGPGTATPSGAAANCAANSSTSTLCGTVEGVTSDSSPNHVVVQVGAGTAAATNGFSVAALSG
jgi:hypothetical protein